MGKRKRKYLGEIVEWDPIPKDDYTWWKKSHCAPGRVIPEDYCECERTELNCAKNNTECIRLYNEECCGCSGFWCPKCGLFYPQDVCLDTYAEEYITMSGKKVILKDDGYIYCSCGQKLFKPIDEFE